MQANPQGEVVELDKCEFFQDVFSLPDKNSANGSNRNQAAINSARGLDYRLAQRLGPRPHYVDEHRIPGRLLASDAPSAQIHDSDEW